MLIEVLALTLGVSLLCVGYAIGRLMSLPARDSKGKFRKR